jgi:carboxypeptidase family protein/TonB-dependent receptor-like protein
MTYLTRLSSRFLVAVASMAIAAVSLAPAPASAQALYGSIVGTVADESGAPVPGVTVSVTNTGTGLKVDAVTDGNGDYAFRNLLPGMYEITAALQNFRELRQTGIRVSAGEPGRHDLKLQVGALAEAVTVVGETALLQTEKADLSTVLTSKEVTNLPLNQFRNYQALLNLVPGATPAQFQNAEIDTPGRALRTFVNGTNPNTNAFRIDGAVSVNVWLPHHVGYVSSAETLETVNVSSNNFDADQGMAGGAAITVVTKSGTNELHGSGFFFRNQDEFNANTFANNAFGLPRLPSSTSIYGATVGGPIVQNKLFFFGSVERYAGRRSSQATYSVPSVRMRAGDFSEVSAVIPSFRLYNPNTGGAGGVGREQFPNNVIPANLISPVWNQLLNFYPQPNTTQDLNRNGLPDDFVREQEVRNDRDNFDLKLSYQRSPAHSIWTKFAMLDAEVIDNFSLGFDEGSLGDTRVYVAGIGHSWTLTPSLVLDGNLGMNRQNQQVTGPDFGENIGLDVLGIPGTNGLSDRASGLPHFDIPFNAAGAQHYDIGTTPNWMPLFRKETSYTFSSALTWITGRHQVRTGIDVVRHELNHLQAEFGGFGGVRGGFQFNGLVTATPGYIPNVFNELGAFVLGLPAVRQKDVQDIEMTGREWQHAFYATDRWHVNNKLTLNLGLRFEMYPLMTRADSGIERLDLNTYEVLLGGRGNTPEDVGIKVKKFYVAPRLGATYRIGEKSVLRAGYGRTFNPLPWSRPMRGSFPFDIFFNQTAEQYGSFPIAAGIPPVPVPDLSSGRVLLPRSTFIRTPDPNDVDRATIQQMNVAFEQRLPGDVSVEVALVHTRTDGGYADRNINFSEPGQGNAGLKYFALAGTTAINEWASRTKSRYRGLQVALNRPFRNGLLLKGAYTLSKSENETANDEDGWTNLTWHHPDVISRNFATAGFDRTHVFQMGFVYELPFAKNSKSILGALVKNWQINGVGAAYSGTPFSITGTNPQLNCPGCGQGQFITINVQGDPSPSGTPGSSTEPWYDKGLFSQPTGANVAGFGNSRRNQFRTPGVWNVDLGLFRSFPMGRVRPEIRIEAQNVFNHTNWGRPDITFTSPTFMTFRPADAHHPYGTNNNWGTATRERTVQVGVRLEF